MKKILFSCLINFLLFSQVLAEEELQIGEDINTVLNQNSFSPNYFGLFFGLFLVIGLIYLTGFIYQKLIKIKLSNNLENNINIISTTSLGQGKNLHIIEIQNKYMLIASTQNNISFLKDLDDNFNLKEKNEQS